MHVRLYNGPWPDGYVRGRNDTLVWGIYCEQCGTDHMCQGVACKEISHMRFMHEIQHPEPGPAMDWARMHHWQFHDVQELESIA